MMTQEVLAEFFHKFTLAYLNDIVVLSPSWATHLHYPALTIERLQQHQLHSGPAKCRFGVNELEYLGYIVSSPGNRSRPMHQEAIGLAQAPKTRKQLSQFIGLCNWL